MSPVQPRELSEILTAFQIGTTTSDLFDDLVKSEWRLGTATLQMRDYGGHRRFGGLASTVTCRDDNVLIRSILKRESDGGVLVVDGGASPQTALVGDGLASMAHDNGWAGIVIRGSIRDVARLRPLPIGVRATGVNPRKPGKAGSGEIDVPVHIPGTTVSPGELVLCDEDGLLVVGRQR